MSFEFDPNENIDRAEVDNNPQDVASYVGGEGVPMLHPPPPLPQPETPNADVSIMERAFSAKFFLFFALALRSLPLSTSRYTRFVRLSVMYDFMYSLCRAFFSSSAGEREWSSKSLAGGDAPTMRFGAFVAHASSFSSRSELLFWLLSSQFSQNISSIGA